MFLTLNIFSQPVRMLAGGLFIAASMNAAGEDLTLEDVFQGGALKPVVTMAELADNPGRAELLLEELKKALEAGRSGRVIRQTEILAAYFPRESDSFGEVLWLRAGAFLQRNEDETFKKVAAEFLDSDAFQDHPRRLWFLIQFGDVYLNEGRPEVAANTWEAIMSEAFTLTAEQRLNGARILLRGARAERAREILAEISGNENAQLLLLESLLIADDPSIMLPRIEGNSRAAIAANLRRALLLELRGEYAQAAQEYEALAPHREQMLPVERNVLSGRL